MPEDEKIVGRGGADFSHLRDTRRQCVSTFLGGLLQTQGLNLVWDGDGRNATAALTVFRHRDSAVRSALSPKRRAVQLS